MMTKKDQYLSAFAKLGEVFRNISNEEFANPELIDFRDDLRSVFPYAKAANPWFTIEFIEYALQALGEVLDETKLSDWLSNYSVNTELENPKTVAVIMAGNIPLVGFSDFLAVLLSGHVFYGKLSSQDEKLFTKMTDILCRIEPELKNQIKLTNGKLEAFDAVIATGSDNSARYFDYYFGKYPHIIRHNRNSVAVLSGDENENELSGLASDIVTHYGLGCRNVSFLYLPKGYDFSKIYSELDKHTHLRDHYKYFNNYEYYRSIFLVNQQDHKDNGFIILKEDNSYSSPVSVIHYREYENLEAVKSEIELNRESIQCVVSTLDIAEDVVAPGEAQKPGLKDYADGVDTMKFLLTLK
jgi:hypothetical protein